MNRLAYLFLFVLCLPAAGCQIYFGGDDDDDQPQPDAGCYLPVARVPLPPDPPLRNPYTGGCEYWGGGGGGCGGDDGFDPTRPSKPDYGLCYGTVCDGLDEETCASADACRGIYYDFGNGQGEFAACWPTAPSGPIAGGGCEGLDAYSCSLHNDCSAVHEPGCFGGGDCIEPTEFRYCTPEAATPPPPACATLGEDGCIMRSDCTPIYEGSDCSCDPSGCHCNTQTFIECSGDPNDVGCAACNGGEYCVHSIGGAPPGVDFYSCEKIPETCLLDPSIPGCDCLKDEPCGWDCQQDPATGQLVLTCALP